MTSPKKPFPFRSPDVEDLVPIHPSESAERRGGERHATCQSGVMKSKLGSSIVDFVNLSRSGAKLKLLNGNVPNTDEKVTLTLFDNTTIQGVVSWLDTRHIGVSFLTPLEDVDDHLAFDDLGTAYFVNALNLQKKAKNR